MNNTSIKEIKHQKIKFKEFKIYTSDICRRIHFSNWRPDYIVGITRGGLLPAVMISQWFDVPCETLKIQLRNGGESETNTWMAEDAYAGKNILVVDDINDQGNTINWLMDDWKSCCYPIDSRWNEIWNNNVKFAVVVDNLSSKRKIKMDFCGIEINKSEEDLWVDFPWEEWWK